MRCSGILRCQAENETQKGIFRRGYEEKPRMIEVKKAEGEKKHDKGGSRSGKREKVLKLDKRMIAFLSFFNMQPITPVDFQV